MEMGLFRDEPKSYLSEAVRDLLFAPGKYLLSKVSFQGDILHVLRPHYSVVPIVFFLARAFHSKTASSSKKFPTIEQKYICGPHLVTKLS